MTPEVKPGPRDTAKIQERYDAWSKLPAIEPIHFPRRNEAWDLYCDARDGLPDGATAAKRSLTVHARSEDEQRQLDLFGRRRLA